MRRARRAGIRVRGASALLLVLLSVSSLRGQEDKLLPIHLGRMLLYPSASLTYLYENNVERTNPEDPILPQISSPAQDLVPAVRLEFPLQRSLTRLQYSARIREYGASELRDASGTSHYLEFGGRYLLTPSLQLEVGDRFLKGISELQKIDPGGEIRFGTQPFRSNDANGGVVIQMGPIHSMEAGALINDVRFNAPTAVSTLNGTSTSRFSYRSHSDGYYARYLIATGPGNQFLVAADWRNSTQIRPLLDIAPGEYASRTLSLGLRRKTGPYTSSEVRIGYATVSSPGTSLQKFNGITAAGEINKRLGPIMLLSFRLRREPQTSYFNSNAFYVNEMLELGVERELGQRFRVQVAAGFQRNSYPSPVRVHVAGPEESAFDQNQDGILDAYEYLVPSDGVRRRDRLESASLKVLIDLGRPLDLELGVSRSSARSNIVASNDGVQYKIFNYDYESFTASLHVGWK